MNIINKLPLFICLLLSINAHAQNGCTDPIATNYDPNATINDGSCIYPFTVYHPVYRDSFPNAIKESSGLVFTDGKLWTHNDSGNPQEIYSIDTSTGAILQTIVIDNFGNNDWEDITADSAFIYVGDFGNNNGTRTDLKILKIAKSDITSASTVHVNAQAISFSYTDQTSFTSSNTHNFDCESVISIKDSLYLFTKDRGDGATRVYKLPKIPGTYAVSPYTNFAVQGLITGADYNPVTKQILLIGYMLNKVNSFIWQLYDYQGDLFFSGNKRRIEISNGNEWQTEGICWINSTHFFVSCEETSPTSPSAFYAADNYFPITSKINIVNQNDAIKIYPNPSQQTLNIYCPIANQSYKITDITGKILLKGNIQKGTQSINIAHLAAGKYNLIIFNNNGQTNATKIFTKR